MEPVDAWLDIEAAALLAGLSIADFERLVDAGAIDRHEGLRVLTTEVHAWRERDRAMRRAALARLAQQVGEEVFY